MIEISGFALYQWDTGRYVTVKDITADHVHFSNKGDSKAVIMEISDSQAKIPDYLLQTGKQICVYVVRDGITVESKVFSVIKREKPEDYIYEEDQRNFVYELIKAAETATEAASQAAVAATEATLGADGAATRATTAAEAAEKASTDANKAAIKAAQTAKSLMVIGGARGAAIHLDDAIEQYLVGLNIFGKTTQDGIPTPDAPVDLVSVGDGSSITVSVTGQNDAQSMTVETPNGLPGIPVTSGGNYTDATGQQWICDEIDLARGVRVKRFNMVDMGTLDVSLHLVSAGNLFRFAVSNIKHNTSSYNMPNIRCEAYPTVSLADRTHKTVSMPIISGNVDIINNDYTDAATFKAAVNGTMLLYEISAPVEIPLSEEEIATYNALHTYRGNTTVSNDAGAYMELEYVMDAKKYIDSQISTGIIEARVG